MLTNRMKQATFRRRTHQPLLLIFAAARAARNNTNLGGKGEGEYQALYAQILVMQKQNQHAAHINIK
jgi:hypothetical protein